MKPVCLKAAFLGLMLAGAALLTTPVAQADDLDVLRRNGKIRIAIAVGVPQFSYLDERNNFVGSDIETAQILSRDMGLIAEIVRIDSSDRITVLTEGRADIVVSSLSITPERERVIDYSAPYAHLFTLVAAPADVDIRGYRDLAGVPVGATRLTSNAALLKQFAAGVKLVEFDSEARLLDAVASGSITVVSTHHAAIDEINRRGPPKPLEEKFIQKGFDLAVAMPKNHPKLREWINGWVVANLRSSRLNDIYRRHHGRDLPAQMQPG